MMKQMSIFLVEHPSKANKNICELAKAFVTSLSVSLTKPLIKKKGTKSTLIKKKGLPVMHMSDVYFLQ